VGKAKAPAWLRAGFAEGVLELAPPRPRPAYKGALGRCWLAQHDPRRRPCSGHFERFHFLRRQSVEDAVAALLPDRWELLRQLEDQMGEPDFWSGNYAATVAKAHGELVGSGALRPLADLILLAAWDPRNGGVGCEGHHRRFDHHLTPALPVRYEALPPHVVQFAFDWGIDHLLDRFPSEI